MYLADMVIQSYMQKKVGPFGPFEEKVLPRSMFSKSLNDLELSDLVEKVQKVLSFIQLD